MKKGLLIAGVAVVATSLTGCAATPKGPGMILSDYTYSEQSGDANCVKHGTATHKNILGLVATGDSGVEAAKKAGQITRVSSVDIKYNSILGIIGTTVTKVCGE